MHHQVSARSPESRSYPKPLMLRYQQSHQFNQLSGSISQPCVLKSVGTTSTKIKVVDKNFGSPTVLKNRRVQQQEEEMILMGKYEQMIPGQDIKQSAGSQRLMCGAEISSRRRETQ